MHHHDQKYIEALLNNDPVILEELYQRFSGKIKWMVTHNNGTEADAADVFQEALLSVYRRAATGNFILTCPFEAFFYTVCKCKWLKELVKKMPTGVTFKEEEEYKVSVDNFKLVEALELTEARNFLLRQKLQELGESCRKLLQMSWGGRPMEEVAKILNISYSYARKKKSRCMAKLIMLIKESPAFNDLK